MTVTTKDNSYISLALNRSNPMTSIIDNRGQYSANDAQDLLDDIFDLDPAEVSPFNILDETIARVKIINVLHIMIRAHELRFCS